LFVGRVFGLYGGRWIGCPHSACREARGKTCGKEKGATDLGSVGSNRCHAGCHLVERAKFPSVHDEWKTSYRAGLVGGLARHGSQQLLDAAQSAAAWF